MAYPLMKATYAIVGTLPHNQKVTGMEIITIESSAYKELLAKIDRIEHHILSVNVGADGNKVNVWLSSKEAMSLLGISPRSLQRLRDKKQINYAMFGRACRYHISEIERLIKDSIIISDAQSLDEFKRNYLLKTGGKQ